MLVPIVPRLGGATLLLTRRASEHPVRGGDVVFPGGIAREGEPLIETALREAEEEVGIPIDRTRTLGFLDAQPTRIGFRIQPVVALVPGDFTPAPDPREVEAVYEIPLAFALAPENQRIVDVEWGEGRHEVANIEYEGIGLWGSRRAS